MQTVRPGHRTLLEHERTLAKQILQLYPHYEDHMLGPLQQPPSRSVVLPQYVVGDPPEVDPETLAFRMSTTDPAGERKINHNGSLRGGRQFLFTIFKFPPASNNHYRDNWFVTVTSLRSACPCNCCIGLTTEQYLAKHNLHALRPQDALEHDLLVAEHLVHDEQAEEPLFVATRPAFIAFGAQTIAHGARVLDDYWEAAARNQQFTVYHRVFPLSDRLISIVEQLKPADTESKAKTPEPALNDSELDMGEQPYPTIMEQPSMEMRQEFLYSLTRGEPATTVIPGQNITGFLDLADQFRLPKYHSRNSYQQALQANLVDVPIGDHEEASHSASNNNSDQTPRETSYSPSLPTDTPLNTNLTSKPVNRLLYGLVPDTNIRTTTEDNVDPTPSQHSINNPLHLHHWKFESLPLKSESSDNKSGISARGLPLYDKGKLSKRLPRLTPREIRELEHIHDCVYMNTGLQSARKIRNEKWTKYWQYKAGIPIGLKRSQIDYFKNEYLPKLLQKTTVEVTYNELSNNEEVKTTIKIPNANYINFTNIHPRKPPYAPAPIGSKER